MRVLVTGATSGIGRATCIRLALKAKAQGQCARIAPVGRRPSREFKRLVSELRDLGAEVLPL